MHVVVCVRFPAVTELTLLSGHGQHKQNVTVRVHLTLHACIWRGGGEGGLTWFNTTDG